MNYQKFVKRWEEVMDVPPQTLGPFTPQYKWLARHFKVMPWPAFFIVSFAFVLVLYFLFGPAISSLVTLLQKGF